jgi:general secretion pathway protein A
MYTQYFGLSQFPFNLTSDPRFFYANRVYQEAVTGVRYGIKLRQGLIVLTGETGTGKTSLVRFVKARCEPNIQSVVISDPPADFSRLLRLICVGVGLSEPVNDSEEAAVAHLTRYLVEQHENGRVVAVLLDEAQDLDAVILEKIASISELQANHEKLLQIVLVGRPELEQRLKGPELQTVKERVSIWSRLEPLRADEVGTYIDRRLARAGYRGKALFERAAVEQIAAYSSGIPRLINVICDNALLCAYNASRATVAVETVHQAFRSVALGSESELHPAAPVSENLDGSGLSDAESKTSGGGPEARVRRDHEKDFRSPRLNAAHRQSLPRPTRPGRFRVPRTIFSRSTSAAVVGGLLMAASVAMLYSDPRELSTKNPSRSVSISQPPDGPVVEDIPEPAADEALAPQTTRLPAATPDGSEARASGEGDAVVYVHVSEQRDRQLIDEIGGTLRQNGYRVRDTRFAPGGTQGDVRFFFVEDRREAEKIKSVFESELGRRGYRMSLRLLERDGRNFEFAAPGKIEVWLPPLSHVPS